MLLMAVLDLNAPIRSKIASFKFANVEKGFVVIYCAYSLSRDNF